MIIFVFINITKAYKKHNTQKMKQILYNLFVNTLYFSNRHKLTYMIYINIT